MSQDKRQYERYDALNLLHYEVPADRQTEHQGMGRTLNVSQSGILLETHAAIDAGQTVTLTIGFRGGLGDAPGPGGPLQAVPPAVFSPPAFNSTKWPTGRVGPSTATSNCFNGTRARP